MRRAVEVSKAEAAAALARREDALVSCSSNCNARACRTRCCVALVAVLSWRWCVWWCGAAGAQGSQQQPQTSCAWRATLNHRHLATCPPHCLVPADPGGRCGGGCCGRGGDGEVWHRFRVCRRRAWRSMSASSAYCARVRCRPPALGSLATCLCPSLLHPPSFVCSRRPPTLLPFPPKDTRARKPLCLSPH